MILTFISEIYFTLNRKVEDNRSKHMTIENQERRIVYDTDGTSLNYPVLFPFLEPEWLEVSVGTGEIGSADTVLLVS